jgi:hypothetical protein
MTTLLNIALNRPDHIRPLVIHSFVDEVRALRGTWHLERFVADDLIAHAVTSSNRFVMRKSAGA